QRGGALAVPAVDRLLGCPQRREGLTSLVHVVELGAHHRAEDAAPPMRRQDADDSHAGGRPLHAAGHGHTEAHCARAAHDRAVVLQRGVHALELEDLQPAVGPVFVRLLPAELVDEHADGVAQLLAARAGADLHQAIFSSGAYSSISLRSAPSSANRTVTTPPGSTRTTTPSPRVPWRTESPVPRRGTCSR